MRTCLIIVVILFLVLTGVMVRAQEDDSEYRLRVPTAEEYLSDVSEILESTDEYAFDVRRVAVWEFLLRYGDAHLSDLSFNLLSGFHRATYVGADTALPLDVHNWFSVLLETGLRDQAVHKISDEMNIGHLNLKSTPVNFDGDGFDEHLLEVHDDVTGRTFYTLAASTSPGDFSLFAVPLPYIGLLSTVFTRWLPETGNLTTQRLADINGDGSTEWIVSGNGYGYWEYCGKLYVIDWQDNALVDLTADLFSYCIPMGQMDTASNEYRYTQQVIPWQKDVLAEIQMHETRVDGWKCEREKVDSLTWNGEEYVLDTTTRYADMVWCELREADLAFSDGDYETAISIYAEATKDDELSEQMTEYLYARLALAYALNGEGEQVRAVFDNVTFVGQMGELLNRLERAFAEGGAETACQAAHDFFSEINETVDFDDPLRNPYEWTPENFYFGVEWIDPRYYPLPYPQQAGCNISQFIVEQTPDPTPDRAIDTESEIFNYVRRLPQELKTRRYDAVLATIDQILALPRREYGNMVQELHYWRALTLELIGQETEAIQEYVAIYEAAPESAWGMLAGLHLESVDEQSGEQ